MLLSGNKEISRRSSPSLPDVCISSQKDKTTKEPYDPLENSDEANEVCLAGEEFRNSTLLFPVKVYGNFIWFLNGCIITGRYSWVARMDRLTFCSLVWSLVRQSAWFNILIVKLRYGKKWVIIASFISNVYDIVCVFFNAFPDAFTTDEAVYARVKYAFRKCKVIRLLKLLNVLIISNVLCDCYTWLPDK